MHKKQVAACSIDVNADKMYEKSTDKELNAGPNVIQIFHHTTNYIIISIRICVIFSSSFVVTHINCTFAFSECQSVHTYISQ